MEAGKVQRTLKVSWLKTTGSPEVNCALTAKKIK